MLCNSFNFSLHEDMALRRLGRTRRKPSAFDSKVKYPRVKRQRIFRSDAVMGLGLCLR